MKQKLLVAAPLVGSVVYADIVTKKWALDSLVPGLIIEGFQGLLPLTLAFNQGVAFGLPLPSAGRYLVIFATILVLFVLTNMFVQARSNDWLRLIPIQLVAAGAIGNLIDRVRWDRGVVDFIGPIDLGFMSWPIFNIADMAIMAGAGLLFWLSFQQEPQPATAKASE